MKNKFTKLLFAAAFACTGLAASAQGLEGVIVESYHTTTQADADLYNGLGNGSGTMTAGLTTYRIYIDMAPNYKLNSVFGSAGNVMDITSTSVFWNDDGYGSQFPPQTSRQDDGAVFDSWITIGRASRAAGAAGCTGNLEQLGVPRVSDTNGNLTMCNLWSGFGPTDNDGMVPGASLDPTVVGISVADLADFVDVDGGNQFSTTGSYALLPAQNGPELAGANRVLIAQVTTAGTLTFHINVSLAAPAGGVEFYTHTVSESGSAISPFLTYPVVVTDADGDGVPDATDACPGTAAGAGVNTQGCSCAQVTVDDGTPCTLDECTNGVVTHTLQDADADGVCDANDNCPGTAAGAGVNTQGCSCAQVTVDDGNPCTLDVCTNGVVTHTLQDADADGVCDANDNCPGTAAGAGVNTQGCSCAQVTVDDGNPCTLDACTNGNVTHTFQDTDADGVCNANDNCPGTAAGAGVNTQGCSCAQVTVDDGNPCTLDVCTNGNVTHTLQDADADGVCDANDTCPGTAAGAGVNTQGCSCAQVTVDDGNPCTLDQCTNGVVTHTVQDTDADGVCNANDQCPGTAAGAGVNTQGCSCAQVTVDDGNPCTLDQCTNGVVTHTFQDSDGDGICNANDNCPNLAGVQGDPCDDLNGATSGDVITANCVCAGVLANDCEGVPGGPAQPGTPCNDNNACTTNDVYQANCSCAGTIADTDADGVADCNDNCPGTAAGAGVNAQGCSCAQVTVDDGNPCTLDACTNGTVTHTFQDSDGDGICNANDNCPNLAGVQGDPCDDLNPNTGGDVITANCVCAGTLANDCNGVPGGPAQPGTPCNDNNACTTNDTYQANCSCAGTIADTDADGVADCNDTCPGTAAGAGVNTQGCSCAQVTVDDGNPCTVDACTNGVVTHTPSGDADGDGICDASDNCPNTPGVIGSPCDDLNANTTGDVIGNNCVCAGTPIGGCTQSLEIEFQLDGFPGEVSWEIRRQATNELVQGGPSTLGTLNAANSTQIVSTCVPNGSFYLKVMDTGASSAGMGGYILRTSTGSRIIDNRNNFTSGTVSQIAGGEGFTNPAGANITQGILSSCDKLDWLASGQYYVCSAVPNVSATWSAGNTPAEAISGYEFWIYNPNGGYSYRRFRSHAVSDGFAPDDASRACHMKINNWAAPNLIPTNVLMNIRVRSRINGVNSNWGPACRFKIDPVRAACPLTKLNDVPGQQYLSCGATRSWGAGNYVYAKPVAGATLYQFRFRIDGENFVKVQQSSTYFVQLIWTGNTLQDGKTYKVEVRAFKNGAWCIDNPTPTPGPNFIQWGEVCDLTIDNTPANGGNQNMVMETTSLRMYPNPNRGDQLYLSLDAVEEGVLTVSVDIFDLFGKRVSARMIAVQDGFINTVLDLNGELASGMYLVNITAGEQHFTERLVIQQ